MKKIKKKETIRKQKDKDQDAPKNNSKNGIKGLSFTTSIKTFLKSLLLIGILGGIAAMTVGGFMLVKIVADAPELDHAKLYATGSSIVRDQNGDVVAD